jgi:hypothetical protein
MAASVQTAVPREPVFNVSEGRHLLGTAFAVRVLDSARAGTFLLTAAHAVRHAWHAGGELTLAGADGEQFSATVLACDEGSYPDIGLIYAADRAIAPLTATAGTGPGAVVIRGGLSGVLTEQASLRGWCFGHEYVNAHRYLDVVLSDLAFVEPDSTRQPAELNDVYAALRGLSGAPVVRAEDNAEPSVTGLIVKRNPRGVANRVYAVPMQEAAAYMRGRGFYLEVAAAPRSDLTLGVLAGRLMARILDSSEGMHELWEEISGLFYGGLPMDDMLRDAIRRPASYGLDGGLAVHELEYFLARLLLKRGRQAEAARLFRAAGQGAALGHSSAHRRLKALVRLRQGGIAPLNDHQGPPWPIFNEAIRTYENLTDFSEHERAYEIASALGAAAADFSLTERFLSQNESAVGVFADVARQHGDLVAAYPHWLIEKQEVVGIILMLTQLLWERPGEAPGRDHAERILATANRGTNAALQRSNGIFYIQMMIARVIAARQAFDQDTAFFLLGLAGDALAKSGLTLNHEGLKVLHAYLRRSDPGLAELLSFISVHGAANGIAFFENQPHTESRPQMVDVRHALRQAVVTSEQVTSVADLLRIAP